MDVLYNEGVVESDSLVFVELTGDRGELLQVRLEGQVICGYGVRVRVLKWMDVRHDGGGRAEVLSAFYQYHAWRPRLGEGGNRPSSGTTRLMAAAHIATYLTQMARKLHPCQSHSKRCPGWTR